MCSITATMVRMPSGMRACVMPMRTPVRLKMSATGASVSLIASSSLFTAPLRPRSTIQANARTRKLVQNGRSTQKVSRLRHRASLVARRYATG